MRVWAVSNQKGGVGKTTTTVALGSMLAESGKRTLLIDMDPHASLSGYIGVEGGAHGSVYDLFGVTANPLPVRTLVHGTQWERLSVLPASAAMITLDRQLGTRQGMGLVLSQALAELAPISTMCCWTAHRRSACSWSTHSPPATACWCPRRPKRWRSRAWSACCAACR